MIESRFLRAVLVAALLGFVALLVAGWSPDDTPTARAVGVGLVLLALTFAVGVIAPGRRRLALRIVAGVVVAFYLAYFGTYAWRLARGEPQPFVFGQPSALMAGIGLLVWGVPLLVYALSGRTLREHAADEAAVKALAADPTGELLDQHTLDALTDEGADLALETDVQLFLLFPGEGHARSAQSVVQREGHVGDVLAPDEPDTPWVLAVHRRFVPTLENVRAARARYTSLATELGGTFDGWEAAVRAADVE
jgi:MFS family permease